jgi:hypothetical protein
MVRIEDLPVAGTGGKKLGELLNGDAASHALAPLGSIEATRNPEGLSWAVPFGLLAKLDDHLSAEEERLGQRQCLPFAPAMMLPVCEHLMAGRPLVMQLVEGPLTGAWCVPMLPDEVVLSTAPLQAPFVGLAVCIAPTKHVARPAFTADERERLAQTLADALLRAERLR